MAPRPKKAATIVPVTSSSRAAETLGANDATAQQTMMEFIVNGETADRAFVGFARLDIIERKIEFGPWNRRERKAAEVSKLLDSFHRNHVSRFEPMHAMPILLNRARLVDGGWVPRDAPGLNFQTGHGIPILKLADDPSPGADGTVDWTQGPAIIAAGGHHRSATLAQYYEDRKTTLPSVQKKVKDLQSAITADLHNLDYKEHLRKEKKWAEMIEEQVRLKGKWLVAIYDEGA